MIDVPKKITVFLEPDLHERLVLFALRRGKKLQGTMVEAAERLLSSETSEMPRSPGYPTEDIKEMQRLQLKTRELAVVLSRAVATIGQLTQILSELQSVIRDME